jgi:hypothetical protein
MNDQRRWGLLGVEALEDTVLDSYNAFRQALLAFAAEPTPTKAHGYVAASLRLASEESGPSRRVAARRSSRIRGDV